MNVFLNKIKQFVFGLRNSSIELDTRPYEDRVSRIRRQQESLRDLGVEELRSVSDELRAQIRADVPADGLLCDAFALVCEVADRELGLRPYDEQVIAAIVLHEANVAEMQTGEGKTLVAVLSVYLNALSGRGVHVLTFNDYLARRDAEWMGPVYRFLGLSVGCIEQGMTTKKRQAAYACDVTYVTAKEAGFDSLRDQLCTTQADRVHRPFHYAIVDEADSIMIDEARVPLVIAGSAGEEDINIEHLADVVSTLNESMDYSIDKGHRNINFTAAGLDRLEETLECGDLHDEANLGLLTRLNLALQADVLLHRDVDYLVRDGKIELIDEFTGRVAENRRWPYGLQAAIEAKERVEVQPAGAILNSITLQHFLQQYDRLAGMTGTAKEAAEELHEFYDLKVVVIPTHKPCVRLDEPDLVFAGKNAKHDAMVEEVLSVYHTGRPILVGTANVEESNRLAESLDAVDVECEVLNAKNDRREAEIVADAGALGAVTISTNMAGRGTDIRLGGRDETDREQVVSLGGLYVLGGNRYESRRIDNQLRGRAGRQGDPGRTRFVVSFEDDLIARYGVGGLLTNRIPPEDEKTPIDDPEIARRIAHAQRVVEGESFEIRRTLRRYSAVLERQRRTLHDRRVAILEGIEPLELLGQRDARRYSQLVNEFGPEVLDRVERQITLFQIDRCWSDHLATVSAVREQIHLFSLGGYNPLDEFHKRINAAFGKLLKRIDDEIVETFQRVRVTESGIDLEKEGMTGPSSTWTYMINDMPMGDMLERVSRGIKRIITREYARASTDNTFG